MKHHKPKHKPKQFHWHSVVVVEMIVL